VHHGQRSAGGARSPGARRKGRGGLSDRRGRTRRKCVQRSVEASDRAVGGDVTTGGKRLAMQRGQQRARLRPGQGLGVLRYRLYPRPAGAPPLSAEGLALDLDRHVHEFFVRNFPVDISGGACPECKKMLDDVNARAAKEQGNSDGVAADSSGCSPRISAGR